MSEMRDQRERRKSGVGDERRQSIVRATYEIIASGGFEKLRTRDVAERVGINIATFHYYFATKEGLVEAVAHHLVTQFQSTRAPESWRPAKGALQRLRQEFADARHYAAKHQEMLEVMQEFNARARRDPAIARIVDSIKDLWRASIERIVDSGIREGVFHTESARQAANVIVTMLWGAASFPLKAREREHLFDAIEKLLGAPHSKATRMHP
jgi:AcrR family transcriptional regulator